MSRSPSIRTGRPRRKAGAACVLALAIGSMLAGCGGSIRLGDHIDDDHDPPLVVLTVSPDVARPGETLRLRASASGDAGIDQVIFFRVDGALSTRLASDDTAPYALDDEMPDGASGTVQFFARAIDNDGRARDSDLFSVSVDR
jgi:hypothetical protein